MSQSELSPRQSLILIVEDEGIIALNLQQQLLSFGTYAVVAIAPTGEEAIELAQTTKPDLVLMDVHLAGEMDGIDAAQHIYDQLRIPIVFLSAYAEDSMLERARHAFPYGYLVKPFEPRELNATIQMALSRRAAESEVERSEERLRLALDAASLGVWEWDSHSGKVTTSGHMQLIFGGPLEPISESPQDFLSWVHPDDRQLARQKLERVMGGDNSLNMVLRHLRAGGESGWVEVLARAFPGDTLETTRVVGVIKDISERRKLEERLRQTCVAFETTAEAIFILDRQRRIVSTNPAFTEITGYRPEEVLGLDPETLLFTQPRGQPFYERLSGSETGQWQGEVQCRRRSGELFPAWQSISYVPDSNGDVTHYVLALADISAIRHAEDQLLILAHFDALTGLPNRVVFNDRLDQALAQARRLRQRLAVMFMDLDGFKGVNDTLGHAIGDLLLQAVAERIKSFVRSNDTAARLGGDEFVLLMAGISSGTEAAQFCRRLLRAIEAPIELESHQVSVSASLGISVYPDDGHDRHSLLMAADTAMYSAKNAGRNRYCFFSHEMGERAAERMNIEQGLKLAVEKNHLVLHYQPQISLADGRLIGIEALMRWRHPSEGMVMPARFIPVAEETGSIVALGNWALHTACRDTGSLPLRLSVNVSALQLGRDDFIDTLHALLDQTGFPPSQLEIEITESTLQVIEHSRQRLAALKSLGIGIAIDDFGTGYSSLSLLKHLPIDHVKIDRSFVQDLPDDHSSLAIVRAVIVLAHSLGLRVIAEGIETEAQRITLCELGCEEGQGYLFGRPQPLADLQALQQRWRAGRWMPE
ncbi:two-component system response regulator [Chitinimonas lacunae]|uniref:EAL domain-containing protein n=1 Tax=Chitinimonas lacunae TaxID=1963018 RepID=A0ABV8MKJ6_9NEIS